MANPFTIAAPGDAPGFPPLVAVAPARPSTLRIVVGPADGPITLGASGVANVAASFNPPTLPPAGGMTLLTLTASAPLPSAANLTVSATTPTAAATLALQILPATGLAYPQYPYALAVVETVGYTIGCSPTYANFHVDVHVQLSKAASCDVSVQVSDAGGGLLPDPVLIRAGRRDGSARWTPQSPGRHALQAVGSVVNPGAIVGTVPRVIDPPPISVLVR